MYINGIGEESCRSVLFVFSYSPVGSRNLRSIPILFQFLPRAKAFLVSLSLYGSRDLRPRYSAPVYLVGR